ncbi:MAG: hypothetical protein ACD_79C00337G0001 [uncultured bacterium]|nr:MAG: hypothetical protein ACD_79C00337G0001 [uncultured bacterium]
MALRGVRISWLIFARNLLLAADAFSALSFASFNFKASSNRLVISLAVIIIFIILLFWSLIADPLTITGIFLEFLFEK